jgi:hypothetical protein
MEPLPESSPSGQINHEQQLQHISLECPKKTALAMSRLVSYFVSTVESLSSSPDYTELKGEEPVESEGEQVTELKGEELEGYIAIQKKQIKKTKKEILRLVRKKERKRELVVMVQEHHQDKVLEGYAKSMTEDIESKMKKEFPNFKFGNDHAGWYKISWVIMTYNRGPPEYRDAELVIRTTFNRQAYPDGLWVCSYPNVFLFMAPEGDEDLALRCTIEQTDPTRNAVAESSEPSTVADVTTSFGISIGAEPSITTRIRTSSITSSRASSINIDSWNSRVLIPHGQ